MHVDWVAGRDTDDSIKRITDLVLEFLESDPDDEEKLIARRSPAYGPAPVKALARYFSSSYYTIRNADSLALYALVKYVQNKLGNIYPHLPLAGDPPDAVKEKSKSPGFFTMEANGTAVPDPSQDDGAALAGGGDPGTCGIDDVDTESASSDANTVTFSANLAVKSDYPADYLSSYSSWASLTPPPRPRPRRQPRRGRGGSPFTAKRGVPATTTLWRATITKGPET